MSMCSVFSCVVGRGCLLWPVHFLGKTLLVFTLFILHSKAKFACYSRCLLSSYFCIPVPYIEKDICFGCHINQFKIQILLVESRRELEKWKLQCKNNCQELGLSLSICLSIHILKHPIKPGGVVRIAGKQYFCFASSCYDF